MPNTHQTLQDIADILSFESDNKLLKVRLESDSMNWDHLVRVGSSHLVLPAIYCRLKAKKLLHLLPQELETYLKEITDLNRERNEQLLAEAQQISQWFQEAKIDHVFLKGTAMLASGYYEDISERMVGDIDILIKTEHLNKSFNLLKKKNYKSKKELNEFYPIERHLPRLINQNYLGAVELHSKVINSNKIKSLLSNNMFLNINDNNSINILENDIIRTHAIMNFQFNDYAYYYKTLSIKTSYDLMVLDKNPKYSRDKFESAFCEIHSIYFKNFKPQKKFIYFSKSIYIKKQKHKYFKKTYDWIIRIYIYIKFLYFRIIFYFKNKDYRKYVNRHNIKLFKDLKFIF